MKVCDFSKNIRDYKRCLNRRRACCSKILVDHRGVSSTAKPSVIPDSNRSARFPEHGTNGPIIGDRDVARRRRDENRRYLLPPRWTTRSVRWGWGLVSDGRYAHSPNFSPPGPSWRTLARRSRIARIRRCRCVRDAGYDGGKPNRGRAQARTQNCLTLTSLHGTA